MPYSTSHQAIREWLPLPAYWPGWQEALAGLPALPTPIIVLAVSIFPLYTSSVLLLDAAPAIPNAVLAAGLAMVIGVVGWLINRTITGFDTATKETKEAVHALTLLVTEMRLERKDDRQLTNYLKERQDALEKENTTLRTSTAAFDKYLAVQAALKNTPIP